MPSRTLFTFDDDEVFESSGLVDIGRVVYTINDSGDDAVRLRRRHRHRPAGQPDDVRRRRSRTSRRSPRPRRHGLGRRHRRQPAAAATTSRSTACRPARRPGPAARALRPDLPRRPARRRDAAGRPDDGRVYVVTKSPFGGTVYAAPRQLCPDGAEPARRRSRGSPGWSPTARSSPTAAGCCCAPTAPRRSTPSPASRPLGTVRLPAAAAGRGHLGRAGRPGAGLQRGGRAARCSRSRCRADAHRAVPPVPPASPLPTRSRRVTRGSGRRARRGATSEWGWVALAASAIAGGGLPRAQSRSTTWSTQAVSASTSAGSIAGNIATRSWLRPSLR